MSDLLQKLRDLRLANQTPPTLADTPAAAWNRAARTGPPAGEDRRVWAAALLDQLERDDTRHMFYQVDWQAFRKLEHLEAKGI